MRSLRFMQQAWDDRHPDDYRTAADDAAEQAAECMADFDRREAERIEVRHELILRDLSVAVLIHGCKERRESMLDIVELISAT